MLNDYELIVFNDAKTPKLEKAIRETCEKYNTRCIRYEQHWHETNPFNSTILQWLHDRNIEYSYILVVPKDIQGISNHPSLRHSHVIQYALDNFGYNHNDVVVIADGDIFPIRPLDVRSLVSQCHIAGSRRIESSANIDYLWVPFIAIDMPAIPNKNDLTFNVDVINKRLHDTGSHMYHYLKNNPHVRSQKYAVHRSAAFHKSSVPLMKRRGFNEREIQLTKRLPWPMRVEFHIEHRLLHFGASSYIEQPEKAKIVKNFIKTLLVG